MIVPLSVSFFSFFFFFFFCKLCPHPRSPALTRRCEWSGGLGRRPTRPSVFVSAAFRVAPNSALPDGKRGRCEGVEGLLSLVAPSSSQTAASFPLRAPGAGDQGGVGGAQAPMAGPRIKESGIRNQIGSRRRRGEGAEGEGTKAEGGAGGGGARAPGCRLPAVLAAAASPAAASIVCGPALPRVAAPPPALRRQMPSGPLGSWESPAGMRPRP